MEVYQVLNFHYLRLCSDSALQMVDLSETLVRHGCRLLLQLDSQYPRGANLSKCRS